jgi:hypothetical protein
VAKRVRSGQVPSPYRIKLQGAPDLGAVGRGNSLDRGPQKKKRRVPNGVEVSGVQLPSPEAIAALYLPPLARQLERDFAIVSHVHAFLLKSKIQSTWKNIREAVECMGASPVSFSDVELMEMLCPEAVAVCSAERCEDACAEDFLFLVFYFLRLPIPRHLVSQIEPSHLSWCLCPQACCPRPQSLGWLLLCIP